MKISIVIPIYNKEKYVEACFESLLMQDFDGFEILAIDDGSTDHSGEICDHMAERDSRIRVFHTPNGGVTAARRKGVEEAQGKYIMFVDSDDQLLPHAIKTLYDAIEKTQADEVIGRYTNQNHEFSPQVYQGYQSDTTPLITDIISNRNLFPILWGLICRKDLVKDCLDTPREIIEGEDLLMQLKILMKHPHVHFINDCVYLYNVDIPNNRKRTLEREKHYDTLMRQILEPEWEKYRTAFIFHQIKQYEEFIVYGDYNVRKNYYEQEIPSPLPIEIPLSRKIIWGLPPSFGRIVVWTYKKILIAIKAWER